MSNYQSAFRKPQQKKITVLFKALQFDQEKLNKFVKPEITINHL